MVHQPREKLMYVNFPRSLALKSSIAQDPPARLAQRQAVRTFPHGERTRRTNGFFTKRQRYREVWGDMSVATLSRYETRHAAPDTVELGAEADPTALLALEDAMIVADFFGFALPRSSEDGRAQRFAQGVYADEFERKRERHTRSVPNTDDGNPRQLMRLQVSPNV